MATVLNDERGRAPRLDPFPADIPPIRDGHLGAVYYGQRRSGDFYDFVRVNDHRVLFGLFDIAGELETTRSIMVPLQETFRSYGPQLLQTSTVNEPESMLELWIKLNKTIMKAANGICSCPAFLGCYNEDVKMLCYVNAGHTPGLCRIGNHTRLLEATALPLGLFSHSIPDSSVVVLGPGNGLLVVSSGVVEAKHKGEEFGLERAREYFHQSRFESAHETCVGVLAQVRQFMGTAPTHNDVTALSLIRSARLEE
jgi:sigma-B regulation protein RsbU (phosphoserine phosphatase)